jgi:cold shock CspA family protein
MNTIFKGRLERWNEDKGFGFIRPEQAKGDIFIHISALKNMPRRPVVGDVIYYQLHVGDDGKTKAINARIEGVAVVKTKKSYSNKQKSNQNQRLSALVTLLFFIAVGFFFYSNITQYHPIGSVDSTERATSSDSHHDLILKDAFQRRTSNIQVEGEGIISKILPDDKDGDRHQKFIVALNSGQTILIAHNIDLAGRIDSIQEGDRIAFNGEYEWNEKGGVVHWTHRDPNGSHVTGWLKRDGHIYQ